MLNPSKIEKFGSHFSTIVLLLLYKGVGIAQQSPQALFQAGLYAEEVQGDLENAISLFQQIVNKYPDQRPLAANAWLHIGFCYEKLGQQKAREAYQKIIEQYPDQRDAVAIAKERLKNSEIENLTSEIKVDPLVKYYIERVGIDPRTSISYNGKYLAYTDWTTGNLAIKNCSNSKSRHLTNIDWSYSHEFAYNPIWSRDDKWIACSWYRGPFFAELRIVTVANGGNRVVYSNPKFVIIPKDWSPDGENILCRVIDISQNEWGHLFLISSDSGSLTKLTRLGAHSRGMKFSPDGKFITYDLPEEDMNYQINRHIYVFDLDKSQQTQVTGAYSETSDTPVWSTDGKFILYRSFRARNYDLWALPIANGKPTANPFLFHSELNKVLFLMQDVNIHSPSQLNQKTSNKSNQYVDENSEFSFKEEFSSTQLDSAWSVYEWKGPNVYGYKTFGRYSFTDNPGYLRYYLDPIMHCGYLQSYQPVFSGHWFWWYPGLEISRFICGDRWKLDTKVTYSLVDGADGRSIKLLIFFNPLKNKDTVLNIERQKAFYKKGNYHQNCLAIKLYDKGSVIKENRYCLSSNDTTGVTKYTYFYRISRSDTLIKVEISEDGISYKNVLSGKLRPDLLGIPQQVALTGNSWYTPAGSYADWDYIRFTILE